MTPLTTTSGAKELEHNNVYGSTFALYNPAQLEDFCSFLERRFVANQLCPRELFEGKRCLDAGAGNGRGAMLMLKNGACHVTLVDISDQNIRSAEKGLTGFGFSNFDVHLASLEQMPLANDSFDFVWCNGVLMHTAEPDRCLQELARVLRPGGRSWIYVYGAGGLYWHIIRTFRTWFSAITSDAALTALEHMGLEVRYIAEYMDDWKTPFLRTYTAEDFSRRLSEVGFIDIQRLWRGVPYDTCERLRQFPTDAPWLGEGDLRYLLTKGHTPCAAPGHPISNDEWGSPPNHSIEIDNAFQARLNSLTDIVRGNDVLGLIVAALLQRRLRDLMTRTESFDVGTFQTCMDVTITAAKQLAAVAS